MSNDDIEQFADNEDEKKEENVNEKPKKEEATEPSEEPKKKKSKLSIKKEFKKEEPPQEPKKEEPTPQPAEEAKKPIDADSDKRAVCDDEPDMPLTFLFKYKNRGLLLALIEFIVSINTEAILLIFAPSGFMIKIYDQSHISIINLFLSKADIDEYDITRVIRFGVSSSDFRKMIKRGVTNEIGFGYDPKAKRLLIKLTEEGKKKEKEFKLPYDSTAIDCSKEVDAVLKIDFANEVTIDPAYLDEIIQDSELFCDVLNLRLSQKGLEAYAESPAGEMSNLLPTDELKGTPKITTDIKSVSYAVEFLKPFAKLKSCLESFVVRLESEKPLAIGNKFGHDSHIWMYLAPRVPEDPYANNE